MCRAMQRGIKEVCCFNFGVLSGVIEKLPRFIPKNTKLRLDREEAIARLEQHTRAGKVATVWFQPVPYVNAICSCETPQCGGLRLRADFGLKSVYKAEYAIHLDPDRCQGCKLCVSMCQFGALRYSPSLKRVLVDSTKCFGCGLCRHACNFEALQLAPREEVPGPAIFLRHETLGVPQDPIDPQTWRVTAVWLDLCNHCMKCVEGCPQGAITVT
jgi:ferredoxin